VGDAASRECIVIDSCWDTTGIAKYAKANDLKIVGAAVTHCHFDHGKLFSLKVLVGGIPPPPFDTLRIKVDGLYTLLKAFKGIKAYANPDDIQEIMKMNPSLETSDFVPTPDNFILQLPISEHSEESVAKTTSLRFIHTPGHTPGSQCILVNEISLFSGDTLFIGTCGRLDLPGSNKDLMWKSLSKLKYLPDLTTIYPGHSYNGSLTTIELEKKSGVLQIQEKDRFLAFFENTGA
jgi:glyoxylase-like metal-dependent hydrolase (beta-lactamase superfamily II)